MLNKDIVDLVQSLSILALSLIFSIWCSKLGKDIEWCKPLYKSRKSGNDAKTEPSPVDKELKRMCEWLEEN